MKRKLLVLIPLLLSSHGTPAEPSPEQRGLEIATEAENRDKGFQNFVADLTMILRNRQGEESVRFIHRKTLEVEEDGDKTLDVFRQPKDIKGTTILTYSHGLEQDDQWIFMPAIKRVKRISSVNKSGPFMGSEFSYEDIADQTLKKFHYKFLGNEVVDGHECFMLERIPAYEYSGYTRQIESMDTEIYQPRKITYYDRKGALLKTLKFSGYEQYLGKHWRPNQMNMENHQSGKTTQLIWTNYEFQIAVTDLDFTQNSMKRIR
ncbi:MAG: outer membrane lipoprotein-sorting protein [Methylococcales bacterium]